MIAQILAEEILADSSQNCQSAKINSPPKFPVIRCIAAFYTISGNRAIPPCNGIVSVRVGALVVWLARQESGETQNTLATEVEVILK